MIGRANASFYFRVTALIAEMVGLHTSQALGRPVHDAAHPGSQTVAMVDAATSPERMLTGNLTLDSPWLRRALQTMIAVVIVVAIIHAIHLEEGFWVVLGIATALKLDAATTRKTAWGAALGTLGGFALAVAMLWLIGDNEVLLIVLLPIVSFFAVWFPAGKFELPLKQAGFSLWFIMLVSLAHGGLALHIDDTRIVDVGIGLAASLAVTSLMWPNGVAARVREVLKTSVATTAAYFSAAYDFITSEMGAAEVAALKAAADKATAARVEAQDAFDVAITQGGEIGQESAAWTGVASSVDHVYFAAATVRSLPGYGLAPVVDDEVGALMREHAHLLAQRYVDTISADYQRARAARSHDHSTSAPPTDSTHEDAVDMSALSDAVEQAVKGFDGHTGAVTAPTASAPSAMSYGDAAVSMLWAQDWLPVSGGWRLRPRPRSHLIRRRWVRLVDPSGSSSGSTLAGNWGQGTLALAGHPSQFYDCVSESQR